MFFYMPTKIYSEAGCVKKYAGEWADLGRKALIVTGKSSGKNGSLQDVKEALKKEGKEFCVFDRIEENPSIETVMELRTFGLSEGADFVVGIGGGSPMDAAKAAALMMAQPEKGAEFLYENGSDSALPLVEVPTTCGTGSEATPYSILTIHAKRIKKSLPHKVFPAYALVDGSYLKSAGRNVLANTAVDALAHCMESYVNSNATDFSRMLSLYGMQLWSSVKNVLIGAAAGEKEYGTLMTASTIAGMAISHTGTALPHGLSYYFTYEKGIPHGKAVGYVLPGYLKAAAPGDRKTVLMAAGFPDLQYFTSFLHGLIGKREKDPALLDRAVTGLLADPSKLKNAPFPVNEEVLRKICQEE